MQGRVRTTILGVISLLLALALAPAAGASRADHTTVIMGSFDHNGTIDVLRHPQHFKVESADSYVVFSGLSWRHWGGRRPVARGKATTCDYLSGCHSHPTVLKANKRRRCADDYSYERMTASVIPLYGNGPFELPVERAGCVLERR